MGDILMNKKHNIIVICVTIILLIIMTFFNNIGKIIKKGNNMFGKDYCPEYLYEDYYHSRLGGWAVTYYWCKLCHGRCHNPTTAVPDICPSCEYITGRCKVCGKLKKVNAIIAQLVEQQIRNL